MADVAVENNEISAKEKLAAATEIEKEVAEEASAATCADAKGSRADVEPSPDIPALDVAGIEKSDIYGEIQDEEQISQEIVDDSTDSTPSDAAKKDKKEKRKENRRLTSPDAENSVETPEKKAKLEESLKEDTQNCSESSEVAA